MERQRLVLVLVPLLLAACDDPRRKQIETIDSDSAVMAKVTNVVNEVVRSAYDCEHAKPLLEEAYARLDEAGREVRVVANRQTLQMMRQQVDRVARECP